MSKPATPPPCTKPPFEDASCTQEDGHKGICTFPPLRLTYEETQIQIWREHIRLYGTKGARKRALNNLQDKPASPLWLTVLRLVERADKEAAERAKKEAEAARLADLRVNALVERKRLEAEVVRSACKKSSKASGKAVRKR